MCMSPRVIQLFADIEQFVRMRADCLYHEATAIVWCYMNLIIFVVYISIIFMMFVRRVVLGVICCDLCLELSMTTCLK